VRLEVVTSGFAFGDGPRWHDGRLWLSDMHAGKVVAIDPVTGAQEVACEVPASPSGLGWLPDGRLLVVAMQDRSVLRLDADGVLRVHADLAGVATFHCNDMVVDGRGNAYVGNVGSDYEPGVRRRPADLALVLPDGTASVVATGLGFPNGSAVTPDGRTLIVAETMGRRLVGFDIHDDGTLGVGRTWADLGRGLPDGIALDAEGAVWYADPRERACVRVAAGGRVLATIGTGDACYACALGGADRRTLYLLTASSDDPETARRERGAAVWATDVEIGGAGWP